MLNSEASPDVVKVFLDSPEMRHLFMGLGQVSLRVIWSDVK